MKKIKTISLLFTVIILAFSCSKSSKEIKEKANKELTVNSQISNEMFYVSNIYKDEELGELVWQKSEDDILKISDDKQNISSLLFDKQRNSLIYSQSQEKDKLLKVLEPLIINSPRRFSKYRILSYDLDSNSKTELLDLSKHSIIGSVQNLGFLDEGENLAFQTHYGEIYFLELDNPKAVKQFIPSSDYPNQFEFDDLYDLETDGINNIFFKARSGYKSELDKSFVYNKFKYNIETNQITRVTNNPYFFTK